VYRRAGVQEDRSMATLEAIKAQVQRIAHCA
jgi:hypothetical protein